MSQTISKKFTVLETDSIKQEVRWSFFSGTATTKKFEGKDDFDTYTLDLSGKVIESHTFSGRKRFATGGTAYIDGTVVILLRFVLHKNSVIIDDFSYTLNAANNGEHFKVNYVFVTVPKLEPIYLEQLDHLDQHGNAFYDPLLNRRTRNRKVR